MPSEPLCGRAHRQEKDLHPLAAIGRKLGSRERDDRAESEQERAAWRSPEPRERFVKAQLALRQCDDRLQIEIDAVLLE